MTEIPEIEAVTPPLPPERDRAGFSARRVAVNTLTGWLAMGVQVVGNFLLVVYALRKFGDERAAAFGLALAISQPISLLTFGVASAVQRLGSEAYARGDMKRLSEVLSATRTLLAVMAAVAILIVASVSLFGLGFFNVPEDLRTESGALFVLMGVASASNFRRITERGALYVKQRHDLANLVVMGEAVLRTGLPILLFQLGYVRLEVLGGTWALVATASALILQGLRRRLLPQVRLRWLGFTKQTVRDVASFTGWQSLAMGGRVAMDDGLQWVVSAIQELGYNAVGFLILPLRISQGLMRLVVGFAVAMRPAVTNMAVLGRRDTLQRMYHLGTRLAGLVMVPATIVMITHGEPFIRWIKPKYVESYPILVVYVVFFAMRTVGVPAEHMILAAGRVKPIGLSQLACAIIGLAAAVTLAKLEVVGLAGFLAVMYVPAAVRGLVYLPLRMRAEIGVRLRDTYLQSLLPAVLVGAAPLAVGWGLKHVWPPVAAWEIAIQMAAAGMSYAAVAWFVVMAPDERGMLWGIVRHRSGQRRTKSP